MNPKTIRAIFSQFQKENPNPTTELIYKTPFELLIAVVLSAQSTDLSVNKATRKLFKVANTPEAILTLGEKNLKTYIQTIGLYNTKAKNILKTCTLLVQNFHSTVPNTREALESLPGVGRKTANVILNTLFNKPTLAVDTHIFRLANRIGLAPAKTPLAVEKALIQVIPKQFLKNAHHWLILHGRYICTAKKPHCNQCLISNLCAYNKKSV